MKYERASFTVGGSGSRDYDEGWQRTFGKKAEPEAATAPPESQPAEVWGYAENDEDGYRGHFSSRDEAVSAGALEYEGEPFYVRCGRRPRPSEFLPDVDGLLEQMTENACDEAGEVAEESFMSLEGGALLELAAWADKWLKCDFWICEGEPERVEPVKP